MTSARIYQAACPLILKGVVKTRLVTGDASIDLINTVFLYFLHPESIRQQWPCHRYHVSLTT